MGKIKSNLKSKYTNNKSTKKYKFVNGGPEWQNENQPTSMLQDKYDAEQRKIAEANAVIFGQKNAALLNQMQEQQLADKARVEAEAEKQRLEDAKAKSNIVQQGVVNKNLIGKNIKQNILQDKQNAANFINLGIQSGNYYSPTWAPTTPAITAQSVGYSAPIIGTEAAGTGSLTGSLMPGGVEVGQNLATTSASSIPTTGKTVVQAASGTGTALTGLGLNIAGEAVKYGTNKSQQKQDVAAGFSDYKSDATYTNKEFAGQVIGSTLKGAGTGIGIGSMVGGVGAVPAALIGGSVGLTYGLGKAIHEKRATTAEQDRGIKIGDRTYGKKLLFGDENVYSESKDPNEIARKNYEDYRQALQRVGNAADNALLSSRKSEINTGFSLKTGAGQQESFGYQAKYGGNIKYLKGGVAKSLGRGAVEYVGKKHEQGGIDLPGNIEVEDGETGQNDYIFSATLRLPNGATYAQAHKNLIQSGATGEEIHQLALSQEAAAGRNPNEIKTMKFAKYGGLLQYVKGGPKDTDKKEPDIVVGGRTKQYWQDLECVKNPSSSECLSPKSEEKYKKYGEDYEITTRENYKLKNAALTGNIPSWFLEDRKKADNYNRNEQRPFYNGVPAPYKGIDPKSQQYLERPFTDAEVAYYLGQKDNPNSTIPNPVNGTILPNANLWSEDPFGTAVNFNVNTPAKEYSEETVKNLPIKTSKTKQPSEKYLKNQGFVDNVKQTPYGAIIYDPSTNTYETGLWSNADESARAALPPVNFNTYKEAQEFGNKLDKYQKSNFSDPKLEQEIQTIFKDPKHQTEYGTYKDLNIKGKLKELYTGELATPRPLSQGDIDFYQREKTAREKNTVNQIVTPAQNVTVPTTTDQTVNPTGITVTTGTEIRGTNNILSKDLQDKINGFVTKYGDLDKVAEVTGINANSLQKILNDRAIDARDFVIVNDILNNTSVPTEVPATLARRNDVKIAPGAPVVDQIATTNTASPGVTYTTSDKVNPAAPVNPTDNKPRFFMGASRIVDENGNVQILTDRPLMGTGAMTGSRLGTPSAEGLEDVRNNPYAQAATIKKDANYTTKNTGSALSYSKAVSGKEDIAKTEWGKRWGYKPGMTDAEAKAAHDAFAAEMRSKFDQAPDEMLGYYQYIIDAGAKIDDKGNRTYSGEDAYGDDARAIFENLKSKGYIDANGKIKKEALPYLKTQATNEFVGPIHNAAGAYTLKGKPTPVKIQEIPPTKKPEETPPPIIPPYLPPYKDYTTRNNLGLLQTIPPIAAAFNPLKAERVNAAMVPYSIRPAAVGNVNLGRMSYNAERAANQQNLAAMNQALQGIAGPGSVAGMLAAKTKADQQSMQIAQAEKNTNVGIANQEAGLNAEIAKSNAQSGIQAQTANAGIAQANAQRAQAANQYNSTMQFGANQENKEQLLGAIDTGVQAITQNELANRQLAATERLAGAMDYTGSYDRRLIYENLVKGSKDKNSELYGKSASELMQLVPYYDKQFYGDRSGVVVAANTTNNTTNKKFGGIKKYISRLGDLNNNKTFKV